MIWSGVLLLLAIALPVVLPCSQPLVHAYYHWVFVPLQSLRGYILGYLPVSIGDAAYIVAGAILLRTLIRWIKYIRRWSRDKGQFYASVLNTVNAVLMGYLWFVIGWGANYYQPSLRYTWRLAAHKDTLSLTSFDSLLVDHLNTMAPGYRYPSFAHVNTIARDNYTAYADVPVAGPGLRIKYSYFGYFLERLAIEGYYNPFTGEGQISHKLPAFMLPFVVSHEMAHQAGIAAEGDANLMAYAVSTLGADTTFRYSAYLNLWTYVNARLARRDSVKAAYWENRLNKLTRAHIDTLDQLSKLYDNDISYYSTELYDSYLKMQQQKEGIKSYGNVTTNAWLLELQRMRKALGRLKVN